MARILVADSLAEDGLDRLRRAGEVEVRTKLTETDLVAAIPSFDALVVRSETKVTAPIIEAGRSLKVVGRAGVGVDNIDLAAATRRGILVVNAPRGNVIAAAEHSIGLLFAVARWIPQANASVKRGEWTRSRFTGVEVRGKTLGIVGLGNIGSEVAKRGLGLEMEVIAYDPAVSPERAEQQNVELVSLTDLLKRADFITIHAPLVEGTRNLLGAARAAGASRFLAQSVAWPLSGEGAAAVAEHERAVLDAGGVVLRYGRFYGPGTYHPDDVAEPPAVHVEEAARRTAEALDAPSGVITVVDVPV
jgi:D-3-phosphoglycerate dehydrogenase